MVDQETYLEEINASNRDADKFARRGKLSQLMILVNGFILTLTAFVTLLIFLTQAKESRIEAFNESLGSALENEFAVLDQELLLAELYSRKDYTDYTTTGSDFKSVLRAVKNPQGKWSIKYLQGIIEQVELQHLLPVVDERIQGKGSIFIGDERIEGKYAVHRLNDHVFIVGALKRDQFHNIFEISNFNSIHRLKVFDDVSDDSILNLTRDVEHQVESSSLERHIQKIKAGDGTLSVAIDVVRDPYLSFIGKLPYLLLLFGATLTIVGTLYVRNNQKQAVQLEIMNSALEDKNNALQSKMSESQELYKKLSLKEQEYETVLNTIEGVLFEVDSAGHIRFINAAWSKITNIDVQDVLGKDLFKFFIKGDEDKIRTSFSEFLRHQETVFITTHVHTQDGAYRSVDLSFSVTHSDVNGEYRVIGTITDIEERRQAEKALDEVEKKYRTIVENAAGGIYQVSVDGRIMSANPALVEIWGYSSEGEIMGSDFNIRNISVSDADTKSYEKAMHSDGFIRNHETQIRRKNGEVIWVSENARAVSDVDGSILYYEGSVEDITQRKETEIALMEAKLNSDLASRAKSEFLANMSHELRTPLNAIIGFSEIIKSEALGEIEQKPYVDYAKDIYSSGSRLLTVINEILGISKIEAGERQLSESIVDLGGVTQTCIDLLAAKIEVNNIDVTNIIDQNLPSIVAEEMAFKQMIMNLLSNAIKFTPADGKITISSEYDGQGDLRVSITDTGVGIDETDIPKALSPFGQLDNALSRTNSGTGLGLTLVDSLVRLHGGRLELLSQKGIGTTVTLVVPEKRVAVKKKKSDKAQSDNVSSLSDYKKS
ncbi:MAG: PAS domain-containing sensor histidine kinase [Alphaproteobacteria bacterium]|nr:MAG: PAS domain-containing sensor histidine kinase [Alphaproteobacteria bacterium]